MAVYDRATAAPVAVYERAMRGRACSGVCVADLRAGDAGSMLHTRKTRMHAQLRGSATGMLWTHTHSPTSGRPVERGHVAAASMYPRAALCTMRTWCVCVCVRACVRVLECVLYMCIHLASNSYPTPPTAASSSCQLYTSGDMILKAAACGYADGVKSLLKTGSSVNTKDEVGTEKGCGCGCG